MFQIRPNIYVQIWRDRVQVENLKTGQAAVEMLEAVHPRVHLGISFQLNVL